MKQDPDRNRSYYQANRERILAQKRARWAANREQISEKRRIYRAANRGRINAQKRLRRDKHRVEERFRRHGNSIDEVYAAMFVAQDGRCYMCGEELTDAVIEHDHTHCPPGYTCQICRRGLSCQRCNRLIGTVSDDVALLRLIADRFEAVLLATRARIAAIPRQEMLDGNS